MNKSLSLLTQPLWIGRLLVAVATVLLLAFPLLTDDSYHQNMVILSLVFAIGASGLNIITGFAGYVSLGQGAFIGLGGYTIGVLAARFESVSPWLWVPAAGLVAAAVAVVLGLVSLRSRGPSFVIITVAFLFLVQVIAINWVSLTNGTAGLTLPLPSWDRDIINWPFYYALIAILALQLLMTWWIRRTKLGMGLIAIREDETKAATIGINLPVEKMIAFVASTVFVGMAGAVYGYYLTFIDPRGMFSILISVQLVLSLLVGGKATLWGPVLGAFLIEPLNEIANNNFGGGNARLYLFGGLLVLVVIFLPKGILPAIESLLQRRRTAGKAGLVGARIGTGGSFASLTDRVQVVDRTEAEPRPLLEVRGLRKHFGGLKAVDGCSFAVPEGTITGLIGPNGSGKTTVFNLIDNTITADGGEIIFAGEHIEKLPSWERAHRGLGRTFQITRLFGEMTVLENVVAAQRTFSLSQLGRIAVSGKEAKAAEELLEFVGMRAFRDQKAHALSYGQQKLVELAQVLMLDPKLILLDEPAGGINPVLIERMAEMIRELNSYGKTFLIVEHNMPFVLALCDPIHVVSRGATMASGTPAQIQTDPAVIDAYLGDDFKLAHEVAN
ncbi:amino acid/amide ABC transporter membrane protein 2 (HAAT family) /amino acid/amide ABC transporter ATP-binding protein 1 (HAAT family) [Micromonospora kangleipakensis]|uniref:Amino acid/amide ABC transporter membrane protein 2 (HAAT family) /amino acid/amide ABC transporter ATP-binding protein 1 (HAAT family) n=1 Tax=Micromonospora kangleipakensis TaxID=1077942 RepID=A0A4Q8BCY4_9ACTN|nr:branched-chain amino acid ABC transporter ATP-binding protein/permease [Micromonospora kangleipakensis]RZU75013.1 amino acid/amide ABC transporter membrane protein 2 (HAAT family) /amino acid/amide ABC transporter ATP-binding protein 1 (HAAT family) [Micromonospora kangleipakensis]